jgi:hypothetical protein
MRANLNLSIQMGCSPLIFRCGPLNLSGSQPKGVVSEKQKTPHGKCGSSLKKKKCMRFYRIHMMRSHLIRNTNRNRDPPTKHEYVILFAN